MVTQRRAGTPLGKAKLALRAPNGVVAGVVDLAQSVFQSGHKRNTFISWSQRCISLDEAVWRRIEGHHVQTLEWIDLTRQWCWRTTLSAARAQGYVYPTSPGPRYGIPLDAFVVVDEHEQLIENATAKRQEVTR